MTLAELRNEYRPYDTMAAFDEGWAAYEQGTVTDCWYGRGSVCAQAWDRGAECAMRWKRYCKHGSPAERPRDFMWPR